jgi:hypothetical protein
VGGWPQIRKAVVRFVSIYVIDKLGKFPMNVKPDKSMCLIGSSLVVDVDITTGVLGAAGCFPGEHSVETRNGPAISVAPLPNQFARDGVVVEQTPDIVLGEHLPNSFEQLGKIARRVLQDLRHAGRPAVERTTQIADARKSAGARGPADDVPTVGRPANNSGGG